MITALETEQVDKVPSGGSYQYRPFLSQVLGQVTNCVRHLPGHLNDSVVLGIPAVALFLQEQGGGRK